MIVPNQKALMKWNGRNRQRFIDKGYIYTKIGETFEINIEDLTKGSHAKVLCSCDYSKCKKIFPKQYNECVKSNGLTFCSMECQSKWQAETRVGKNHPNYMERIKVNCDWCNKELERPEWRLKNNEHNFCNYECARNWHREVFVKSPEFTALMKNVMVNNLNEGKISSTESKPQIIINELLTDQKIKYINEIPFGDFSIDIQLENSNLFIEVNGEFWHCDNRFYNEINYEMQLKRIKNDKIKKTYITNKLNKKILYLWEFDIVTDLKLCHKLILEYINNNGRLENYHSFNYYIDEFGNLKLKNDIIKPYMDWHKKDLAKIIDLSVREKVNRYDPEKNVTFNCENCGKEVTRNKIEYNDHKHHYCSVECRQEANGKHDYECDNCGKPIEVKNYVFNELKDGKRKSITCSRKCQGELKSKRKKKSSN
jgi:hypothetical protein